MVMITYSSRYSRITVLSLRPCGGAAKLGNLSPGTRPFGETFRTFSAFLYGYALRDANCGYVINQMCYGDNGDHEPLSRSIPIRGKNDSNGGQKTPPRCSAGLGLGQAEGCILYIRSRARVIFPDLLFPICRWIPRARPHAWAALPALEPKMKVCAWDREELGKWAGWPAR